MSTPFTEASRATSISDGPIWRELLLALVERNQVNDPFQPLPFVYTAGMTADEAVQQAYVRFGGQMANGQFWRSIYDLVAATFTIFYSDGQVIPDASPLFDESTGVWSSFGSITHILQPQNNFDGFYQLQDGGIYTPYAPLNDLRFRRARTDAELQALDTAPRGRLQRGDIIGPHTLLDLQRLLSVVKYIQYGSSSSSGVVVDGAPGTLTSLVSKTVRLYNKTGLVAPYTLELTEEIGPTNAPLESLYNGPSGFLAELIVVEYHWTNFGVN